MKRTTVSERAQAWVVDYSAARKQAIRWLGDRYLLARPINVRQDGPRKPSALPDHAIVAAPGAQGDGDRLGGNMSLVEEVDAGLDGLTQLRAPICSCRKPHTAPSYAFVRSGWLRCGLLFHIPSREHQYSRMTLERSS